MPASAEHLPRRDLPAVPATAPLKVAMIAACPFPAQHGTPSSVIEMCTRLGEAGVEVHVVTYFTRDYDAGMPFRAHRIPPWGVPRGRLGVGPSLRRILYDFLLVFKVIAVVRRERIDLIHSHNYEGGLAGWLAALVTRRPHVYHAHNTMIDELPQYEKLKPRCLVIWLARTLDYWVPRTADRIVAISAHLHRFLVEKGIPPARIALVPLEMSMRIFEQPADTDAATRFALPPGPRIIYTGTLDRFQRLDYLIQAFALVRRMLPHAGLLLVANQYKPAQLEELRELARRHGVADGMSIITDSVLEDLPALLAAAGVAVVSRPDCPGIPMKILNYLAAGSAIVCFANSARFLVHEQNALLAADHDVEQLAAYISRLLSEPGERARLGAAARESYRVLQSQQQVPKLLEVYRQALGGATGDER